MQKISEQQILSLAPNANAAANGKKIAKSGGFVRLERSADDTFYLGECKGSGKSNYITSADFIEQDAPVFRCSCPSRQFPCKHSLALLYEIMEGKPFNVCEIPQDILQKRAKKQARDAKAQNVAAEAADNPEAAEAKKKVASKSAKAAKAKKIKKQMEGLELTEKLIQDLLKAGLGTLGGTALTTYRQLSKQLGDYYLPGPQRLLNHLILEIEAFQNDGQEKHYETAIDILKKMWTLTRKSKQYLQEKIDSDDTEQDDSVLFEELGGIWKLADLESLGRSKANVELIQLAFWVLYDEARKEFIDTGCWVDMESGEIHMTYNYRPLKALKYVKEEDSVFDKALIPSLVYYPGEGNLRVRWNSVEFTPVTNDDLSRLQDFASSDLKGDVKVVKNLLKNPLSPQIWLKLIHYTSIARIGDDVVLVTEDGSNILLKDMPTLEPTVGRLCHLPDGRLFHNQVLLGAFYYDPSARRLQVQPISIVTETGILRLLY